MSEPWLTITIIDGAERIELIQDEYQTSVTIDINGQITWTAPGRLSAEEVGYFMGYGMRDISPDAGRPIAYLSKNPGAHLILLKKEDCDPSLIIKHDGTLLFPKGISLIDLHPDYVEFWKGIGNGLLTNDPKPGFCPECNHPGEWRRGAILICPIHNITIC